MSTIILMTSAIGILISFAIVCVVTGLLFHECEKTLTREQAIQVLEDMKYISGLCQTEKEAINTAISSLKSEEDKENDTRINE